MHRLRTGDWLLPVLVCVLGWIELGTLDGVDGRGAAAGVLAVSCAALVLRRRWPLVAAPLAGTLQVSVPFVGPAYEEASTGLFVIVIAVYSLARWVAGIRGFAGVAVILIMTLGGYTFADLRDKGLDDVLFVLAFTVPPYVFGRIVRRLTDYNEVLAREQELVRREAVRDERDRIAREMHDVIAHSLSSMVVQVAAAQDLVQRDPARALAMLDRVASTGRGAIAETGRLLHLVRDSSDELGLAPPPGLRDLDQLVAEFERDELHVRLAKDDVGDDLPEAIDLAAYRVAREALTNALRYAADRTVDLAIIRTPHGLTVRTRNATDGRTGEGSGLGLVGLAERVGVLGGTLHHGTTEHGVFELVASLPMIPDTA